MTAKEGVRARKQPILERGISPTVGFRSNAPAGPLRLFGRSLVFRGIMKWNPMEGIRSPKISPLFKKQPLSLEQVETLLKTLQEDTLHQLRDKALLYLMLKTGLRGIEVVRADVKQGECVLSHFLHKLNQLN